MKALIVPVLLFFVTTVSAQRTTDISSKDPDLLKDFFVVGGEPFVNTKFTKLVSGTPFFKDDWMSAVVIFPDNRQQKDLPVKINLHTNEVHYIDLHGAERVAMNTLKEIVLTDSLRGTNFRFVHSSGMPKAVGLREGWYLWLHSGDASLYKVFNKTITETKPYGSSYTEQSMKTTESYLVHYNNALIEIKKIKDAPAVLANKKAEVEDYLKNQDNKSLSTDDRMARLMAYYNSLLKSNK